MIVIIIVHDSARTPKNIALYSSLSLFMIYNKAAFEI